MTSVERAIRRSVRPGTVLATPTRGARFSVAEVDHKGVVLLFGEKETRTRFSWETLEGVRDLLAHGGWLPIGGTFSTHPASGTLDAYLKQHVSRGTAGWVAALLEAAGVLVIDRSRPARVRLAADPKDHTAT